MSARRARPAAGAGLLVKALPRYAALAEALAGEIMRGRHPVGARLPTEQALCTTFGVSRATVREALRRLRELGLVAAEHGVGTRVVAARPRPRYEMAVRSLADLQGYAGPTRLEVEERREIVTDAALAERLGCEPGTRLLRLRGLRRRADAAGTPISSVEMYVPVEFAAVAERPEVGTTQIYKLIERHLGVPIVAMEQEIGALALDRAAARRLEEIGRAHV